MLIRYPMQGNSHRNVFASFDEILQLLSKTLRKLSIQSPLRITTIILAPSP